MQNNGLKANWKSNKHCTFESLNITYFKNNIPNHWSNYHIYIWYWYKWFLSTNNNLSPYTWGFIKHVLLAN